MSRSERVDDYDYAVPEQAVAQEPAAERTDARLLFVSRGAGVTGAGRIPDLVGALSPGDLLVVNETAVAPARLSGVRIETGGRISLLLLNWDDRSAEALLGTRGTPRVGELLQVGGDRWRLAAVHAEGRVTLQVVEGRDVAALLDAEGRMPLPPYIRRHPLADARDELDRERYQTTFARCAAGPPAVAAPTAGLHLTRELLAELQAGAVDVACLSLAVGAGTFRPMRGEWVDDHEMHAERYDIPASVAQAFAVTRRRGGRVVAVGTTVVRALESAVAPDGRSLTTGAASTDLFIRPGHDFRAIDALLTNFHQPRSTLLVLVSAFAGRETIQGAYREALARGLRLFSYGDAMLLS